MIRTVALLAALPFLGACAAGGPLVVEVANPIAERSRALALERDGATLTVTDGTIPWAPQVDERRLAPDAAALEELRAAARTILAESPAVTWCRDAGTGLRVTVSDPDGRRALFHRARTPALARLLDAAARVDPDGAALHGQLDPPCRERALFTFDERTDPPERWLDAFDYARNPGDLRRVASDALERTAPSDALRAGVAAVFEERRAVQPEGDYLAARLLLLWGDPRGLATVFRAATHAKPDVARHAAAVLARTFPAFAGVPPLAFDAEALEARTAAIDALGERARAARDAGRLAFDPARGVYSGLSEDAGAEGGT